MHIPVDFLKKIMQELSPSSQEELNNFMQKSRDNHAKVEQKRRDNHGGKNMIITEDGVENRDNHEGQNGENELKTAFSAKNSRDNHAVGGVRGGSLFINDKVHPNDVVTRDYHVKEKINKKESENVRAKKDCSEDFEIFWAAWPRHFRKTDKATSFRRFKEVLRNNEGLTLQNLLDALEWWKRSNQWLKDGPDMFLCESIPAPEVWLNKSKWKVLEQIEKATMKALMPAKSIPAAAPAIEERKPDPEIMKKLLSGLNCLKPAEAAKC